MEIFYGIILLIQYIFKFCLRNTTFCLIIFRTAYVRHESHSTRNSSTIAQLFNVEKAVIFDLRFIDGIFDYVEGRFSNRMPS